MINFNENEKFKNSQEIFKEFAKMDKHNTDQEIQDKYAEYMNAYTDDLTNAIRSDIQTENSDHAVLNARGMHTLTNEEKKFYNKLVSDEDVNTDVHWKDEYLLPETIVDRIFEDLEEDHPILQYINVQRTGLKTRVIRSNPEGQVVWGKIFGEIRGQLDATFYEQDISLGKATAFVVVPKDLADAGVQWVDRYVRTQIKEAFAVAIEKTAILGKGKAKDEPVGLMKEIDRTTGAVKDKESVGTITLKTPETAIKELNVVIANLSLKEIYDKNGEVKKRKNVNVLNNVVIGLNPADYVYILGAFMQVNNGQFVSPVPFNIIFVTSEFIPKGKAVAFDKQRYLMGVGSESIVRKFDQTLALEDCDVYTAKQFIYGEPEDHYTSIVLDVDFTSHGAPVNEDSQEQKDPSEVADNLDSLNETLNGDQTNDTPEA
ncbi:phage major capsid protein [Staphylococcus auricularis]|uniref:Phage major capsid protein n=1 Tax=Staphylococcus auricularis TaxID=29379 RepID=A0AAP8PPJ4_9STAP|nr:phage major capsid protein [Staphylococcus auricularis]PNZ66491.1 phage major capsid protein [Staphylococcus auricularis]QPT06851.1 phage major capsid protein [Staphylococcus auricularis]BCU52694.1 phage major capsid protein [Staphylococcus auricularis]SQJ13770.1 Phage major capsid protein [Staphylococcus auricularis]